MFIRSARCSNCQNQLPVTPCFNPVKFPPYEIECSKCHARIKTSFSHRMTWLSWLVWLDCWILCSILLTLAAVIDKYDPVKAILVIIVGSLILGIGGGFIVCIILPLPLQVLIDLGRFIFIQAGWIKQDSGDRSQEADNLETRRNQESKTSSPDEYDPKNPDQY